MEKKPLVTAALSGLIFLAVTQLCFVKFTNANPYDPYMEHVRVPALAYPSITILSPAENNTVHNSNNLTISLKATADNQFFTVSYKTSWQPNNITVLPDENNIFLIRGESFEYSGNLSLTGIPEGNQTVIITVDGRGDYHERLVGPGEYPWELNVTLVCYYFDSVSYYTVGFTVDTVPPQVSVLELDNKTFVEPEVPLSFTVNEAVSKIAYALDGKENVTVAGNTTLTGLAYGAHNLTVYAVDAAGNIGASETVTFTVSEPFPVTAVAVASTAVAAVICVGLVVYLTKTRRKQKTKNVSSIDSSTHRDNRIFKQ